MQQFKDNQREDTKLAYIAGLIDGEGSIRIQKQKYKDWNDKYTPQISFTNTNLEAIKLVQKFFQTSSCSMHTPGRKGYKGNKICYRTTKAGKDNVLKLVQKLLPYLVIKKQQAKLVIEYAKTFKSAKGLGTRHLNGQFVRGGRIRSEKESKRREKIYQEFRQLNSYHPQRLNEETLVKSETTV